MSDEQTIFGLGTQKKYVTSVDNMSKARYIDPLTLNFKMLINFDKNYGLLADEKYVNSALAYLKRIGDDTRYEQLKTWIDVLKIINKDYDFLLQTVEGLDIIKNAIPGTQFKKDDKITFTFNETSDLLIESIFSTYRHIWFDDIRHVEILPTNLREFDISVLLFSSGYYSMDLYDDVEFSEYSDETERNIFPTKRKLQNNEFNNISSEKFNHVLFNLKGCKINTEETGKSFVENVSNEPGGDTTKNNLVLNFKFATYKGRFNNIQGDIDFVGLLALMSVQNKKINSVNSEADKSFKDKIKDKLKQSGKNLVKSTKATLQTKKANAIKKVTGPNSVIGSTISKFTVANAEMMIKNTLDVGINFLDDKLINDPLTKVNNILFQNFSNNLIDIYENNFSDNKKTNIELIENQKSPSVTGTYYNPENVGNVEKGIKLANENIYNRSGF